MSQLLAKHKVSRKYKKVATIFVDLEFRVNCNVQTLREGACSIDMDDGQDDQLLSDHER